MIADAIAGDKELAAFPDLGDAPAHNWRTPWTSHYIMHQRPARWFRTST